MALEIPASTVGTTRAAFVTLGTSQLRRFLTDEIVKSIDHAKKRLIETYSHFSPLTWCASQLGFSMPSSSPDLIAIRINTGILGPW